MRSSRVRLNDLLLLKIVLSLVHYFIIVGVLFGGRVTLTAHFSVESIAVYTFLVPCLFLFSE